jgi:hypothetical protein
MTAGLSIRPPKKAATSAPIASASPAKNSSATLMRHGLCFGGNARARPATASAST